MRLELHLYQHRTVEPDPLVDTKLMLILERIDKMATNYEDFRNQLRAHKDVLMAINRDVSSLHDKIMQLQETIDNSDGVPEEVQAEFDEIKILAEQINGRTPESEQVPEPPVGDETSQG